MGKNRLGAARLAGGREIILFLPLVLLLPAFYGHAGVYYTLVIENLLYMLIVLSVLRHYMVHMPTLGSTTNGFPVPFRFFKLLNRKTGK